MDLKKCPLKASLVKEHGHHHIDCDGPRCQWWVNGHSIIGYQEASCAFTVLAYKAAELLTKLYR